jgi:hypothetical protein
VATAVERLTEAHRLGQSRIGAATATDLLLTWGLIDPKRLDETTPVWLRVAVQVIQNRHRQSAGLAGDYVTVLRLLQVGESIPPVIVTALDVAAVSTSLTVTGPVSLKNAMSLARPLDAASDTARSNTARAAMRHALAGGRDTIAATVASDPVAVGYRRVTSGDACKFCEMLAGRGEVYGKNTSHFASHDGCSCNSEPVYRDGSTGDGRRVADWTGRNEMPAEIRAANNARVRDFIARMP